MTWLIAQTLNEKQHSTDISLSLFNIPHRLSKGMPFLSVSLPVHLFFFFCPFLTLLFSFSLSDL